MPISSSHGWGILSPPGWCKAQGAPPARGRRRTAMWPMWCREQECRFPLCRVHYA